MSDRRASSDRRLARDRRRDRRRKGEERQVAIELTSHELRLAELHRGDAESGGGDAVTAAIKPWRRDSVSLATPEGRAELTAALRDVARDHALQGAAVRLVLSGDFCIVRTLRGTIEEVRAELQQLEQRSRLYLALGPGEKVLVSHSRALDARHTYALAAACNRSTLDAIQVATEAAGVDVRVIEPALVAVSRAVSRLPDAPTEPCLVIHLDQDSMEIGVCHQGRLLMDYRPGGRTSIVDLPKLLESHLNRLNRHVSRFVRSDSQSLKSVFLCGDAKAVSDAALQFRRAPTFDVRQVRVQDIQATWKLPEEGRAAATAPVLGGLLAAYMDAADIDSPNLMQHILDRKREPLRPTLLRSVVPLAATVLVALGVTAINYREQGQLDALQAEFNALAPAQTRATELRLKLTVADAKLAQLEQLASQLPFRLGDDLIRRIGNCLPSDVWLDKLEVSDGRAARVHGASYLEAGVYEFVRWLEQAPGLDEVALKRTNPGMSESGPITDFELELNLGDAAAPATKVARHE